MAPTTTEEGTAQQSFYTHLRTNQIRLVEVLQERQDERLACKLETVLLEDNPSYVALSYTWGSPIQLPTTIAQVQSRQPSRGIYCDGHLIDVTDNLHAFLLRARHSGENKKIWIDAISINQADPRERAEQVQIMSAIYHSAESVHAWLGEDDQCTPQAFDLMHVLARICASTGRQKRVESFQDIAKDITPKNLNSSRLQEILGPCANSSYWDALAQLFQRTYFTRAWIAQEIILGQNIMAMCGGQSIHWHELSTVSEFLTVTAWTRWISQRQSLENTGTVHRFYHSVPNMLTANKETRKTENKNIMLYSLIRCRRFEAGDPRDKVYALLGIAGDSVRGKSRFTPIYEENTTEDTFISAAIQILQDSDDLLLLAHAEGQNFRPHRSLPSWVPDWSCHHVVGLGVTGYKRYAAAGNLPRSLTIHEDTKSLVIKGFRLDDIVLAGEKKQDVLGGKNFSKWLSIWNALPETYHTGQSRFEVFWRTLITDTAGTPAQHPAPEYYGHGYTAWITSTLGTAPDPIFKTAVIDMAKDNGCPQILPLRLNPASPTDDQPNDVHLTVGLEEYEATLSHALHLRLFLTSRRYLGMGSESLREHDSVWIIPGSRVPLILREARPMVFHIVGGAYVHGFMRAEALESSVLFRDIIIE